jgi:hypothetical protein
MINLRHFCQRRTIAERGTRWCRRRDDSVRLQNDKILVFSD